MGTTHCHAAHYIVDTLVCDFIMLLNDGLEEADAQFSAAGLAGPPTTGPLDIPERDSLGAINYRGKV